MKAEDKPKWLISTEDLKIITNDGYYDWVFETFRENGITSPEDAYWAMNVMRFEYTHEDCPKCGMVEKQLRLTHDLWECRNCRSQFSITSSTFLSNSKLEYHFWLRFAWLIGTLGVTNSCVIAKDLGVTQKTAWLMIDTLRTARKQTSPTKFKTGSEVLVFNHHYEVLEVLLKRINQPELKFK